MSNPTNFLNHRSYSVVKIEGDSFTIVRLTSMPTSASPQVRQEFDYTSLDAVTSQFVQQQTGEIRTLMKRTAQDIIELGQKLIAVKQKIGHGRFEDWLKAEFDWTQMTANRFMNVAKQIKSNSLLDLAIAPSALYEIFAPSTPEAARTEALNRAASGESITYKAAKAIKQKYATPSTKPHEEPELKQQLQPVLQSPPTPIPEALPQARLKQQIVAIIPPKQIQAESQTTNVLLAQAGVELQNKPTPPSSGHGVPGGWWQLGGKHLLYCGEPNSPEFLERFTEAVQLLFAFPSASDWQPGIRGKARIIVDEYLLQSKNLDQLDEFLESNVLFNSNLKDTVVSCFLPSPDIITVISRLDRRGILADPDLRRCNAIISDWKKAGLKVEQLN